MDILTVHGLVAKDVQTGEYDKVITLITAEHGKITVSGKGVKSLKSPHMPATQPFAYSLFTLKRSKKYYYISDSSLIECFFGIRSDLDKLALAAYICDVAAELSLEDVPDTELLRLTLNTLFALDKKNFPLSKIKGAFELRCASISGFLPDLSACDVCKSENPGDMYIDIMNGRLVCKSCRKAEELRMEAEEEGTARLFMLLSEPSLGAMRYVVGCPVEKFLSFSLDSDELYVFSTVCEAYLLNHLEKGFSTLDFYKNIIV